ncbi:MAG: Gfo/Idh/MocA family oxidoreductase [Bacteroidales bacterium]|nr:Gfo/Idh/MocA family oxidoreductase [Bacteroidales bacterium]
MKRRKFFQTASYGIAGLTIAGSCTPSKNESNASGSDAGGNQPAREIPAYRKSIKSSFSGGNFKSANDTIVVALIGAGSWGTHLILQAVETDKNIRVKYICDVDDTRGGRAISELEQKQGFKPIRVRDMRKVYDDKEVDAVFIETPQHWHGLATIWACQAGKDVYVEKCISYNIFEGQQMIDAAMKYERIIQCGTQNRSAVEALTARDYIKSGELGDLVAVHIKEIVDGPVPFNEKKDTKAPDYIDWDMWLGPAPKAPYSISRNKSWGYYWDYAGGYVMSNGIIHQVDMARLVLDNPGFPKSVYCTGGRYFFDDNRDVPDYQMATLDFGKYVMTLETGECTPYMEKTSPEIRFGQGFPDWSQNATDILILGTKRMMHLGVMGGGWQVFDKGGKIVAQQSALFPLKPHLQNYFDCIRSRKQPNCNIVEGHKSATLVHLANMSYRVGCKQLIFSPESETILNHNVAQSMVSRDYRNGFEIPKSV